MDCCEKIPAKVIVKYLEDNNEKDVLADETTILGTVGEEYSTKPKEISGYKLVQAKFPQNVKGVMTDKNIEVIYYYEKMFDMLRNMRKILR